MKKNGLPHSYKENSKPTFPSNNPLSKTGAVIVVFSLIFIVIKIGRIEKGQSEKMDIPLSILFQIFVLFLAEV